MLGLLIEGFVEGVSWTLLARAQRRRRLRRWARAFAEERDVAFLGFADGPVGYSPRFEQRGGALVLSAGELYWTADPAFGRSLWHRIPNERLVVVGRTEGPGSTRLETWPGYDCLDGGRSVLLLCEPDAEPYLRAALFLPELAEEPVTDARVDPEFWAARQENSGASGAPELGRTHGQPL